MAEGDRTLSTHPFPYLTLEARLVALTRALRKIPDADLPDPGVRAQAYVRAGLAQPSPDEDAQALRRAQTYWERIAPVAAAALQAFADAKSQPIAVLA